LHPFERAREYSKAVVATKLDKIFAKPFIGALDGHVDSVYCTAAIRNRMTPFISGACDGDLRVWDLSSRSCVWSVAAHTGFVRGIAPDQTGNTFYTCSDDKVVKQWALTQSVSKDETIEPLNVYNTDQPLNAIDHHWVDSQFATAGESVCLWESSRSDPLHTYKWGADAVISVAFNPAESCLLGSTGSDRSVCLYDLRASVPMRKFVLSMKSNKLAWNPREPFNFALANEDNNIYTFDMRNLNKALMVHKDHVSAVLDVAFSPTGREFVTGSYDRTIRIFAIDGPRSREVYHTKRMQRVFSVNFSADSRFVLSGSDDTNIRIWKTNAAKSMGVVPGRQERKEQLHDALKRRYAHMPEVKRIAKHKREPKSIRKAAALTQIQRDSERKKNDNRKRHAREGEYSIEPERKRAVLREYE
jgi:DDB1- and CUL4-associated factor 13